MPSSTGEAATNWSPPEITITRRQAGPALACTPQELARLRSAWESTGPEHDIIARRIAQADQALQRELLFPPRGGQHNQWYQCDRCQLSLRTITPTKHRCPKCLTDYTGEPYDDVLFSHAHHQNLAGALHAAWIWAITGADRYASHAAKVLLGYAERYEAYPYHCAGQPGSCPESEESGGHLFEQTLNEACAMAQAIAPTYDLIHGWKGLSRKNHESIRDGLFHPMLKNMDKRKAGKSNWQTWHNAGMLAGGIVLGDPDWVKKAIYQPENGFVYQASVGITDEGMWYENSWGYHFYTLQAMTAILEGARRNGMDLWAHPKMKPMFLLPFAYRMPDGSLPRFGDSVSIQLQASPSFDAAYSRYGDPLIGSILPHRPTWDAILYGHNLTTRRKTVSSGSAVFPGAGHAILRTNGPAGLAAVLTFSPYGGFHGHLDKLSFVLFGYGTELAVDPGRAQSQAYRLPIHKNWYKGSVSHNTVVVDTKSQDPADAKLRFFVSNAQYAAAAAHCAEAYPPVKHERLLTLTPDYLLVVDILSSDKVRLFDWVYHNHGKKMVCPGNMKPVKFQKAHSGYEYITGLRSAITDNASHFRFIDDKVTVYLVSDARKETECIAGLGPFTSVVDRVPIAILRRRGKSMLFACVLEPVIKGKKASVTAVTSGTRNGNLLIEVQRDRGTDRVTWGPGKTFIMESDERVVLKK